MSDKETYESMQGFYIIPIIDKAINIGVIVDRDVTYQYWEYGEPVYNWFMDYGAGFALVENHLGLIGMQIQQKIYHRYAPAYPKQTIFNLGLEFREIKKYLSAWDIYIIHGIPNRRICIKISLRWVLV